MTDPDIRLVIEQELRRIAPDVDPATVDPEGNLREECDIDSMDFLNLVTALHRRLGIDIPELDYPKLTTLKGAADYLKQKIAEARSTNPSV